MLKDIPKFPEAYRSRANQLRTNVKQGKMSVLDILGNIVAVMERVHVDPTGIQIGNRYRIDAKECRTIGKALIDAFDIFSARNRIINLLLCKVFKHLLVLNDAIFALDCFPSVLVSFNIIGNRPEIFLGLNRAIWRTLIPVILSKQVFAAEL